ncbi:MAG: thioesterase family protein [Chitinophagales bacterium]
MFVHEYQYRVPYPEVDRLNVVHHGHYAKYFELGRLEAMRAMGWSYKDMEDGGIGLFVVEMQSKFLKPATYDEVITIITTLRKLPGRKVTFETEILNEQNDTCCIGTVNLLFINKSKTKVCSIPSELKKLLQPYFKSGNE